MKMIAATLTAAALFFGAASESHASFSFLNLFGPRVEVIATVSVKQQQMFLPNERGWPHQDGTDLEGLDRQAGP